MKHPLARLVLITRRNLKISSVWYPASEYGQQTIRGRFWSNSCKVEAQTQNLVSCCCPWGEIGLCPNPTTSPMATNLKDLSLGSESRRGRAARAPEGLKRTTQSGSWMEARSFSNSLLSLVSYTTSCSTSKPPDSKISLIVSLARFPLKNITLSPFLQTVRIFSARIAALPESSPEGERPSNS